MLTSICLNNFMTIDDSTCLLRFRGSAGLSGNVELFWIYQSRAIESMSNSKGWNSLSFRLTWKIKCFWKLLGTWLVDVHSLTTQRKLNMRLITFSKTLKAPATTFRLRNDYYQLTRTAACCLLSSVRLILAMKSDRVSSIDVFGRLSQTRWEIWERGVRAPLITMKVRVSSLARRWYK